MFNAAQTTSRGYSLLEDCVTPPLPARSHSLQNPDVAAIAFNDLCNFETTPRPNAAFESGYTQAFERKLSLPFEQTSFSNGLTAFDQPSEGPLFPLVRKCG